MPFHLKLKCAYCQTGARALDHLSILEKRKRPRQMKRAFVFRLKHSSAKGEIRCLQIPRTLHGVQTTTTAAGETHEALSIRARGTAGHCKAMTRSDLLAAVRPIIGMPG
jgi:protein tyrosine phosphatase (PTP) superfamily phosphohydrolase (DUF442 family)